MTVMGDASMNRLSDAGSIPARSIKFLDFIRVLSLGFFK